MRLHHLTVASFGPFAGTESVDFDELNDAGLFLLTGPTGAGKSSLLDAVCFALYGTVPGVRGVKTLKSQHATPEARPEVVLDFTVRDRRFVVRRSPEWSRPKRRGEGFVVEKASASITETTGGDERFVSARAAEVGLLVTDLMGMHAGQFVQVALLPQGEFQIFLRATSQERHDVLQQLFGTDRFARIEDWVHEHSRRLRARSGDGESTVQRILDTLADRSGAALPAELSGDALARSAADEHVLPWVRDRLADAEAEAGVAASADTRAGAALETARRRHHEAVRRDQVRQRRDTALRTLAHLDETAAAATEARRALAADDRASRCGPVLSLADRTVVAVEEARRDRDRALLDLEAQPRAAGVGMRLPDPVTAVALATVLDDLRRRSARLEALLPRAEAAGVAAVERDRAAARLEVAERTLTATRARVAEVPGELAELAGRLESLSARSGRHDALMIELVTARDRHAAAVELREVSRRLLAHEDDHRVARDRSLDARERVQLLAERRLAGMAAELAGELVAGEPCQVCGSAEHPRPARADDDAVSEADQTAADDELAARLGELEASDERLRRTRRRRDTLAVTAGGAGVDEALAGVEDLSRAVEDAAHAAAEATATQQAAEGLRAEQAALSARQATVGSEVGELRETVRRLGDTIGAVDVEIAREADDLSPARLPDLVTALVRLADRVSDARAALVGHDDAVSRSDALTEQAADAAAEHGFASVAEARSARLDPDARARSEQLLRERDEATGRATAVLEEDTDQAPGATGTEHVDALARALREAEATAAAAARRRHLAEERVAAVRTHSERLAQALTDWTPVRDDSLRADSMSRLVRGMGHDNLLQMRLSAYVLATRLDQVVAAANERLGQMRDQRYLLQRTGRATRKGAQAGLGLEIVDQWTGDVREPTSLSGGETFVVSLSLALGLADVVTQEAGGTEIETLFVDEGFGTLDADTLDDVMDRLDGLRAGGRTVGVVSHVSELRNRIPTQVHVEKGRSGSSIALRQLVG